MSAIFKNFHCLTKRNYQRIRQQNESFLDLVVGFCILILFFPSILSISSIVELIKIELTFSPLEMQSRLRVRFHIDKTLGFLCQLPELFASS